MLRLPYAHLISFYVNEFMLCVDDYSDYICSWFVVPFCACAAISLHYRNCIIISRDSISFYCVCACFIVCEHNVICSVCFCALAMHTHTCSNMHLHTFFKTLMAMHMRVYLFWWPLLRCQQSLLELWFCDAAVDFSLMIVFAFQIRTCMRLCTYVCMRAL